MKKIFSASFLVLLAFLSPLLMPCLPAGRGGDASPTESFWRGGGLLLSQTTLTPEMIADLRFVSQVAISPSGKEIAFIQRVPGEDKSGMFKAQLMTVPYSGGTPKLVLGKADNPSAVQWAADGKKIFYLAKDTVSKYKQVFSVTLPGGATAKITPAENNVEQFSVSPDGKLLAFIYTDAQTQEEKENEKKLRDWIVYDENEKFSRLYLMNIADGTVNKLFEKNLHVKDVVWSPDSKTLVFLASEKTGTDYEMMFQKIYRIPAAGGSPEIVCSTEGKLGSMSLSPDGSQLAFCGATDISDPLPQSVFVVPLTGGTPKNLCQNYEGSAMDVKWVNKTTLLMLSEEGCYSALKKIDALTGKYTEVYNKGAIIRSLSFYPKMGQYALVASTPQHPFEVFSGSLLAKPKRITDSNPELKKVSLAKQEVISWAGADNLKIEGVLTYPLNYQKGTKYPLLLQLHGGPEGVSANGWNTRAVYPVQWYAANGYFVLEPNYRGSAGRGVQFTKADHKDLGGKEFDDVLAGIDFLIGKGMADGDRVGTGGFSYGGYFSAWAATKHSQRFKAAVMGAGISDWLSFTNTTDILYENSHVHWNCWWYDNMELYWSRSPLAHINNAKTPTLIIHGDKDDRVPISQGIEMYNALKIKNVPTKFVVYQRQPHGILEREAQIDYMNRSLKWFDEYVKE